MKNYFCPQLGFGIMRFQDAFNNVDYIQTKNAIDAYMEEDFCYFDIHPSYVNGMAQSIFREYVVNRYSRDKYLVANKMPFYDIRESADYERVFHEEISECGVEVFDYYMLHALTNDVYKMHEKLGGFDYLQKLKGDGKVKNIGFSFHDSPELLESILNKHPEMDFVQLQINFFDWDNPVIQSKECYEVVHAHGKRIIVMEPIKGGSLANPVYIDNKYYTAEELAREALRFVANLPGIYIILSGMTDERQVRENRKTLLNNKARQEIDVGLYESIKTAVNGKNPIPCTGCGYCRRECPKDINIPGIIQLLNGIQNVGRHDTTALGRFKILYSGRVRGHNAGLCIACRKCEKHCPQKIGIQKMMEMAKENFEDEYNIGAHYTDERNAQILIYLLKMHGVRKIVASPGYTNVCFVASVQSDSFFEIYSAPDERSAAYIACGMAEESGETVALSCTGATASRNYYPGLTEAYYSKLPILVITSSRRSDRIGHNFDQVTDRTRPVSDVAKISVIAPYVRDKEDEWACEIAINKAILETKHGSNGPAHINLETMYSPYFGITVLPKARKINRYSNKEELPNIPMKPIAIAVGAHKKWGEELVEAVDRFCEIYNAAVLCDHTSNYTGKYAVYSGILSNQIVRKDHLVLAKFVISIGNISGTEFGLSPDVVWRVNPDGEIRDTFWKLQNVFEMDEVDFFTYYTQRSVNTAINLDFWKTCSEDEEALRSLIPELPFSNVWMAEKLVNRIPKGAILQLGILNSLRSWSYFKRETPNISVYSNTGGFGIDGSLSTLLGNAIVANCDCFCVLGDLAFFYDMNALGNHHVNKRMKILLINNGTGVEMKLKGGLIDAAGLDADSFMAATGHYGSQSEMLVKDYVSDLGFLYLAAHNKDEFLENMEIFIDENLNRPIVFEAFVNDYDDNKAYSIIRSLNGEGNELLREEKINPPERIKETGYKEVIVFGTGKYFKKRIGEVSQRVKIKYACDNNSEKWGEEVAPGVVCMSPGELKDKKDYLVIIMIERASDTMRIAGQLIDMGITMFDHVDNWLRYY